MGYLAPLLVAVFVIPQLISGMGTDRFGVLALCWMILGYFSLFDLGLGRALTKIVGENIGANREEEVPTIIITGLVLMLILGLMSLILVIALSKILATRILHIPILLQDESYYSFRILAFSLPFVTLTAGLRGLFEAYQRFGIINIIRTLNGIFTFIVPLVAIQFSPLLNVTIAGLAIVRVFIFLLYFLLLFSIITSLKNIKFRKSCAISMIKLGGWMSVSNIIGPIMVYFDRFLIGMWLTVTAVAYYVTPYEIITKILLVATALARVLFPAFSTTITSDHSKSIELYSRGLRIVIFILFPIIMLFQLFAFYGLDIWVGQEFADHGTPVLQWLALGVLWNAVAQISFSLIQAAGRADITAKLHVLETPVYLFLLFALIKSSGITGAALAWTLRIIIDAFILLLISKRMVKEAIPMFNGVLFALVSSIPLTLIFVSSLLLEIRLIVFVIFLLLFVNYSWKYLLTAVEKKHLLLFIKNGMKKKIRNMHE